MSDEERRTRSEHARLHRILLIGYPLMVAVLLAAAGIAMHVRDASVGEILWTLGWLAAIMLMPLASALVDRYVFRQ